ncbi:MAG: S8 family serine peptidase, partial [Chitinophagaceae bacterium]
MKINPVPFLAVFLFFSSASFSQVVPQKQNEDDRFRISLKSGSFIPQKNIGDARVIEMNKTVFKPGKKSFVIIQFEKIPTSIEKEQLKKEGIELLEYVPNNAYTATVTGSLNTTALSRIKIRAIVELTPEQKMEPSLANGIFPSWAVKAEGTIDVWVSFPKTFSFETVSAEITAKNFDIVSTDFKSNNIIALRIATNRLKELASFPFIDYVQTAPKRDEPLNFYSTALSRANTLSSSLPAGRNLKGDGIVIGVGDLINPWQHFDLTGRFINRSFTTGLGGSDYHGLHVAGTIGGAGIIQEVYTGYAPKSKIITQFFSGILAYAPEYVQDHGMVITNNSYGNPDGCASYGVYDLVSRFLDQQAFQLPNLQHVFSAGNSGNANCSPYPAGYANVLGGYQSSKNPICVGSNDFGNSSKGPVKDGRIKPEIVAQGIVTSLNKDMTGYRSSGGTSHSSPGVSGGLALLYQRYKQLNSGSNPKSGLMKTLLCNGAIDIGNAGVDFHYGFGLMNLLRSVTMLENTNYFNTSVNTGDTNTHTITLPGGSSIAQLKVMLYWNDSAAAPLVATTLVNDLDLQVTDPSAVVHLPQLLNTNPPNVALTATTGADHLNNIEQVVINNPAAGTYTFSVNGTTIPSGANHEYFLAFDTIPVSTKLTYPLGGEHLRSGDNIRIGWDSYGNPANDFTLQYSIDNGTNWIPVTGANIAANLRQFSWTIPAIAGNATSQARVKIIHNGTGIESISDAFTIVGVPQITLAPVQCEGYIALTWPAITGATDYEIMLLQGEEMVSVGTTASLNYTISGLSKDSLYWVSLRSRVNGMPGRRDTAISRQPNTGTCAGTISDNDLKIDTILSPAKTGRKFTSTALSATTTITIRIENLDDTPTVGDIPVTYIIGANPPVTETIFAPNI